MVLPNCESDEELLECLATLLLETERTIASRITGYFENMVHDLSDSALKKEKNWSTVVVRIVSNLFNRALSWLKKLINQTNRKRFLLIKI